MRRDMSFSGCSHVQVDLNQSKSDLHETIGVMAAEIKDLKQRLESCYACLAQLDNESKESAASMQSSAASMQSTLQLAMQIADIQARQ